jgi:predicted glycogen debranching enzyme
MCESADASLWLINAIGAYAKYTNDDQTVSEQLLPAVLSIVKRYRAGIALGIECDADGLLSSRQPGMATSWMNAKIADWVITPRAGRPVELNALWYNALRIAQDLSDRFGRPTDARECGNLALLVENSFNRRFWNTEHGNCYDVITESTADASIRPNQLIAISLPYPVLNPLHWHDALKCVQQTLLTPFGLRTLAPIDPAYEGRYQGDVVSRDRAYHQGSVYPWLLGPYVTALVRANGQSQSAKSQARQALSSCIRYMETDGLGHIPELFDGDAPHHPGGAIASARSVAEILRCYVEDILDPTPPRLPNSEKTPQLMP